MLFLLILQILQFKMWSIFHYLFIISPFIVALIIYLFTRKSSAKTIRWVGIALSIICILLLLLRNLEIFINSGFTIEPEIIPIQICHFANFVLLFAYILNNKTLHIVSFCFNLPFAFMSILFANSLENYTSLITWRATAYIWGHMLIVGMTIWALLVGTIKVDKKAFLNGIIFIMTLFILSVPINSIFNKIMPGFISNYFYTYLPEEGTPLDLAYSFGKPVNILGMEVNIIYILVVACFGILIYFSFYKLLKLSLKYFVSKTKSSNI